MKNLKNINNKILTAILAVALVACDINDFGDLNKDPNNTTTALTSLMLTSVLRSFPRTMAGSNSGMFYVQYVGNTQYTDADNYQSIRFSYNGFYTGPLADLQFIIDANSDPETAVATSAFGSNGNQIAVAKILMSYYYFHMTSRWGDVPFTEALQASGETQLFNPKFDSQQSVMMAVFANLKSALTDMDSGAGPSGDILFGGDMTRWAEFANTTRLIAALRMSKADPATGQAEFNSAISDGVLTSDITYQYLADANNENPWFSAFRSRADWSLTATIVDYMNISTAINPHNLKAGAMDVMMDPRLPKYAEATEASVFTEYVGQPYGLKPADAGSISNAEVSMLGLYMRQQDMAYPIFTMAQVLFSRAEAAQLGWTGDNVQQLYEDAVLASLTQYGVEANYATFMTNSELVWDPAKAMERISVQKWLALYLQGYEAWSNWRRTGFPALLPSPNGISSSTIPTRQGYPVEERDLNSTNWQAAIDSQFGGKDDLNGVLWLFK